MQPLKNETSIMEESFGRKNRRPACSDRQQPANGETRMLEGGALRL